MSDPLSTLLAIVTDPVYGLPLLLWGGVAIVWLYYGHGTYPPPLLPYRTNTLRPTDPVSAMYWAVREHRYSEAIYFSYQRLAGSFLRRYGVSINYIPWRRKKRRRLGLDEPKPYFRILREMVKGLELANRLERPPSFKAWAALRRPARERALQRRLARIFSSLDVLLPMLEGRS